MQPGIPTETAVRVYKRYLRLEPSHTEEYVAYLKSKARTPSAFCFNAPRWPLARPVHAILDALLQHQQSEICWRTGQRGTLV